jgi:glycosyltransferase involved in cell wall biosynthesis
VNDALGSTARLSVVIAAHNAVDVMPTCLAALEGQQRDAAVEVIVADSSTDGTPDLVARRFPWVRLLHFDAPLAVPVLRGRGIAAAQGEVIAILDPYSVVASEWVERVLAAHASRTNFVIGGAVDLFEPGSRSLFEWALYLNEYGLFMPPIREGETWIVPGSNVSYKRAALFDGERARYPIFWKTFVNWEIERSGSPLWLAPDVRVALNKPIPFADFLRTRYHHGRCFAGMRLHNADWSRRLRYAASTALLPAVQVWRWSRGFWPKRRHRLRFAATLPLQLAFFAVWAWGEACGYLRGTGRSCEQLFY